MKKFMISVLCFVLTASLISGCRSKSPAGTDSPTGETGDINNSATEDFTGADDGMSRSRRFSGMN